MDANRRIRNALDTCTRSYDTCASVRVLLAGYTYVRADDKVRMRETFEFVIVELVDRYIDRFLKIAYSDSVQDSWRDKAVSHVVAAVGLRLFSETRIRFTRKDITWNLFYVLFAGISVFSQVSSTNIE